MSIMQLYSKKFFNNQKKGSRRSAEKIVPIVMELIHPKSVVDVGCGIGTWLSVFMEHGVKDILGIDGSYINKKQLQIPEEYFIALDVKRPIQIKKQFDLVVSLEVSEHLPDKYAETFIDNLVRLGSVILFSAAIPFQHGTHHVNEQWPEYWCRLFKNRDYLLIDCIRRKVWQNKNVDWWYAQNILMFVKQNFLKKFPLLRKEYENTNIGFLSIVHPEKYLNVSDPRRMSLRRLLSILPSVIINTLRRKIKNLFIQF